MFPVSSKVSATVCGWALLVAVASGCSTPGYRTASYGGGDRAPASIPPTVLRMLLGESTDDGVKWLAKVLASEAADAEGTAMALRVRNAIATLKPAEIREDDKLMKILSKEVSDLVEADARYLLDVAGGRAVNLANCPECLLRRKEFLGHRKLIRERLQAAAGDDREARVRAVGFLKRLEVLFDKGMVEPKRVNDLVASLQMERFRGSQGAGLTDTIQLMLISVGKDIDPKAAAEIINSWPDSSLKGLRRFYSELTLVQATDNLEAEAAAEVVLRRLNITDGDEIRAMKVCSLVRR